MTSKILDGIPYQLRYTDEGSMEISDVEDAVRSFCIKFTIPTDDIINVFNNNKNYNELTITVKDKHNLPNETEIDFDKGSYVHFFIEKELQKIKKENIVKQTAKELGITQKELAERIGVNKDTLGNWARGAIETPKWAIEIFKLLKMEQKFNTVKRIFSEEMTK